MSEASKKFVEVTSRESTAPTFLPGLVDGIMPLNSLDGPRIEKSGLEAAPVSPLVPPANTKAKRTRVISGPISFGSSPSACLQQSLESRLRARMDVNGSPEYELIWKHWDTESQAPICALRASARRISVSVSIGWPIEGWPKTPMASDGDGGVMEIRPGTTGKYKLRDFAQLAGWATATATDGTGNRQNVEGTSATGKRPDGTKASVGLQTHARLVGWNTAMANDSIRRGQVEASEKTLNNSVMLSGWATAKATDSHGSKPHGQGGQGLHTMAQLTGWNVARATDGTNGGPNQAGGALSADAAKTLGPIAELFFVPTGRRVVLAPEFSLWLMGFPEAWGGAAPHSGSWVAVQAALESECSRDLETQSSQNLPPNS